MAAVALDPTVLKLRQFQHRLAERVLPLSMDLAQVRVLGIESAVPADAQFVRRVKHQVDRRPDGHVRAHGGVERDEGVLGPLLQRGAVVADAAVENGPPVLALADLEVRRILRGAERVALWIYQIEIWLLM